ncbi:MAG: hypothetical protein AAFY05_15585 [Pseudomonadota bacterium]
MQDVTGSLPSCHGCHVMAAKNGSIEKKFWQMSIGRHPVRHVSEGNVAFDDF